jgi:hypothetical protein
MLRLADCPSYPSRRQRCAKLTMREKRDIPGQHAQTVEEPVGAIGDVRRRLAMGTAIEPHIPTGTAALNVGSALAFVIAVVPFHQIRLSLRQRRDARQFTRLARAPQWTGQNQGERG